VRGTDTSAVLGRLFSELVDGTAAAGEATILNTGDVGLVQSLEKLSAAEASRSTNDGATVAAHTQHLRFGIALLNRWAAEGGNPFANAAWDEPWKIREVDASAWNEIRAGFRTEAHRFLAVLREPRELSETELGWLVGTIAHVGYHLGAIRQIDKQTRGPREGTFHT
jgi:hypothetical protein